MIFFRKPVPTFRDHALVALARLLEVREDLGAQRGLILLGPAAEPLAGLEAELAMLDVYQDLVHREFKKAAKDLKAANRYYRDKRILLAMVALKIFPRWTSRLLLARKHGRQMAKARP